MGKLVCLFLTAAICSVFSKDSPAAKMMELLKKSKADLDAASKNDTKAMERVWEICSTYSTPGERRFKVKNDRVEELEAKEAGYNAEEERNKVPRGLADEIEEVTARIAQLKTMLKPFDEAKKIATTPRENFAGFLKRHEKVFDGVDSPDKDKEASAGKKETAEKGGGDNRGFVVVPGEITTALLQLQSKATDHHRRHTKKQGAPKAKNATKASRGVTKRPAPPTAEEAAASKTLKAKQSLKDSVVLLIRAMETAENDAKGMQQKIDDEVTKSEKKQAAELDELARHLKDLLAQEHELVDTGRAAASNATNLQEALQQARAERETADTAKNAEHNMCHLYRGEFDRRMEYRGVFLKLITNVISTEHNFAGEVKHQPSCCACGKSDCGEKVRCAQCVDAPPPPAEELTMESEDAADELQKSMDDILKDSTF